MSEIVPRLVAELKPHPLLARMTTLPSLAEREARLSKTTGKDRAAHAEKADELQAEWSAFVADVIAHGVLDPIKTCGNLVVDGRHRLMAAVDGGLMMVPTIEVSENDAREIILSSVSSRRHFSKGSLAYIGILTFPEVATEGAERAKLIGKAANSALSAEGGTPMHSVHRGGAKNPKYAASAYLEEPSALSAGGLAKRMGVSHRLLAEAAALYRELQGFPKLQAEAEAAVFTGAGLGAVHGWVKAQKAGDEKATPKSKEARMPNYSQLAPSSLITLKNAVTHWSEIKPDAQAAVINGIKDILQTLPAAVRDAVIEISN